MPHCTFFDDRMSNSRQFVFLCPYVAQPSRHPERVNECFDRARRFFSHIFEFAPFSFDTKVLSNHRLLRQRLWSKKAHAVGNSDTGSNTMRDVPARADLMPEDMAQANADIAQPKNRQPRSNLALTPRLYILWVFHRQWQ